MHAVIRSAYSNDYSVPYGFFFYRECKRIDRSFWTNVSHNTELRITDLHDNINFENWKDTSALFLLDRIISNSFILSIPCCLLGNTRLIP